MAEIFNTVCEWIDNIGFPDFSNPWHWLIIAIVLVLDFFDYYMKRGLVWNG